MVVVGVSKPGTHSNHGFRLHSLAPLVQQLLFGHTALHPLAHVVCLAVLSAAGNSAYVLSGSPGSTDRGAGSPAAAMLLPARDNPHRLFIRSPPPSTAAAANGSSLSPARGQADDIAQTPVRWVASGV